MVNRLILAVVLMASPAWAQLRVAQIFQDHMVLQRDMKAPVWGWADAGATVKVSFAGQEKSVAADARGKWRVDLDPIPANATGQSLVITAGDAKIERNDVLVGEVWLLSGQSNMARALSNDAFDYPFFKDYANDADYPTVRFTPFGHGASSTPQEDVEPPLRKDRPWKVLGKSSAMEVMSIGFFFAKDITKELKVPVGLVMVAVSGTPQTAWMPRETVDQFADNGRTYDKILADMDDRMSKAAGKFKSFAEYEAAVDAWRKDPASTPQAWPGARDNLMSDYPTVLYNTRLHPLIPLAFRGMLWHQGEAGPYGPYGTRMAATVKRERELFGHEFVFIWGTMTRMNSKAPPLDPIVGNLRANITLAMIAGDLNFGDNGRSALVNFIDIGNPGTHWAMKEEAGRRMALAALDRAYGKSTVFTGPQLTKSEIAGGTITCTFRHVGAGLKYTPTIDGISGVIGIDKTGKAHWADLKVTAPDTLTATIPGEAAGLYYASDINPHETLFNAEGFTAFPFQVGNARVPKPPADAKQIVQITQGGGEKIQLHVSHVRREGYVFSVMEWRGSAGANVKVKAYIPAEWKGVEIRHGDKLIEAPKSDGFVELDVQINGDRITVAKPGASEGLSKINRF